MKIALPSRNNNIDDHFGHCEYFTVFTVDNKEIVEKQIVDSPVGCGCKSNIASTLSEMGVTVMLAGNMGNGAVNVLKNAGIEVIRGCSGNIEETARKYLAGSIKDSGDECLAHGHECNH